MAEDNIHRHEHHINGVNVEQYKGVIAILLTDPSIPLPLESAVASGSIVEDDDPGRGERDSSVESLDSADAEVSDRDNSSFGTPHLQPSEEPDVGTNADQDAGFNFDDLEFLGQGFDAADLDLPAFPEWANDTFAAIPDSGLPDTSQRHLPSAQSSGAPENLDYGFGEDDFIGQDVEGVQLELAPYQERTINIMDPLNVGANILSTLGHGPQPDPQQAYMAVPEPNFCQCQSYTAYLFNVGQPTPFPRNCCELAAMIFPHVSSIPGNRRFFIRSSNPFPLTAPQGLRYSLSCKTLMEECFDVAKGEFYEVAWIRGEWTATAENANTSLINVVFGLAAMQGVGNMHAVPGMAAPPRLWRRNIPVMPEQVSQGCSVCRLPRPPGWHR